MTHDRIKELMDKLSESQALVDRLLDCQEAHLREIDNLNTAQQSAEQRAEHFKAERDALIGVLAESRKFCELSTKNYFEVLKQREALQAELSSLKADMFVLNNDMAYTTGVLEDVLKQRDALQAECDALRRGHDKTHQMIDRAIAALQNFMLGGKAEDAAEAIEILTREGE